MIKFKYLQFKYQFWHWLFQWKVDYEGDIAFVLCNTIAFIKYKEHTIVKCGKSVKNMADAPKHVME